MRKLSFVLLGAFSGAALTLLALHPGSVLSGASAAAPVQPDGQTYQQLQLFGQILDQVRADYVDAPDVDKLVKSAINGMVAGLDPHSSYHGCRELSVTCRWRRAGSSAVSGIEVTMEDGLIKVVSPIDGAPAAKAGVQANDSSPISMASRSGPHPRTGGGQDARAGHSKIRMEIMREGKTSRSM